MKNKLLLFGAGGHCRSVIDSINRENYKDIGILDIPEMVGKEVLSIPVIGSDDEAINFFEKGYKQAFINIGGIGNPEKRINLYNKIKNIGFKFPVIIDSTAIISSNINIEEGVFIGKGVILNTGVKIGKFSIINTGSIIDHDCTIGDFTHIAPGVKISGGVSIKDNTHIGIGASIIQSVTVGKNTIIGAGSVVVSDIEDNITAFGAPCKKHS